MGLDGVVSRLSQDGLPADPCFRSYFLRFVPPVPRSSHHPGWDKPADMSRGIVPQNRLAVRCDDPLPTARLDPAVALELVPDTFGGCFGYSELLAKGADREPGVGLNQRQSAVLPEISPEEKILFTIRAQGTHDAALHLPTSFVAKAQEVHPTNLEFDRIEGRASEFAVRVQGCDSLSFQIVGIPVELVQTVRSLPVATASEDPADFVGCAKTRTAGRLGSWESSPEIAGRSKHIGIAVVVVASKKA